MDCALCIDGIPYGRGELVIPHTCLRCMRHVVVFCHVERACCWVKCSLTAVAVTLRLTFAISRVKSYTFAICCTVLDILFPVQVRSLEQDGFFL